MHVYFFAFNMRINYDMRFVNRKAGSRLT